VSLVAAFEGDEFDCVQWVNSVTAPLAQAQAGADAVETRVSELIVTLQTSAASVNATIDATVARALTGIPRSVREIERVRSEASVRARKLDQVTAAQAHADAGTVSRGEAFVTRLAALDSVKQRLEGTAALLRQARRVHESLSALPALLARVDPSSVSSVSSDVVTESADSASLLSAEIGDATRLASELRALERALAALRDVPHFDSARTTHLDATRRLEMALAPRVERALVSRDTAATRSLLELFDQMGASDAFVQLYYACREQEFEALWRTHAPDAAPDAPVLPRLQSFYDAALIALQQEARWLEQALPASMPPVVLAAFVVRALTSLAKPVSREIERAQTRLAAPKRLDALIEVRGVSQRFALAVCALVPERRRFDVHESALRPLRPSIAHYEELAYAQLNAEIEPLRIVEPAADADYGQTLRRCRSTLAPLFLAADGSVARCEQLTQLSSGAALLRAQQRVLTEYAAGIERVLAWARRKARLDVLAAASAPAPTIASASSVGAAPVDAENYDWTFLQGALELLSAAAEFSTRLQALEASVRDAMVAARDELLGTRSGDAAAAPDAALRRDAARGAELSAVLRSLADGSRALPQAAASAATMRSSAQAFVFDTMLWFARQRLLEVPSQAQWTTAKSIDTSLPDFSLAPSAYVMQVGEHLLALPQQLAPHADVRAPDNATWSIPLLLPAAEHAVSAADDDDADEGARWARAWLGAVARQLMQLFVRKTLEIRALSQYGRAQLAADISYICNVVDALGIGADEQLRFVQRVCLTPPADVTKLLADAPATMQHIAKRLQSISQQ
jgi:hypothetical protein